MNKFKSARMHGSPKLNGGGHGFTLVELLVVIGILAILTAIVLVAINPARQLAQSRNTSRRANVNAILGALSSLDADPDATTTLPDFATCNDPLIPFDFIIDTEPVDDQTGADGSIDLESFVSPDYIADVPEDPQDTVPGGATDYKICQDASGIRYTVCGDVYEAPVTAEICVTR